MLRELRIKNFAIIDETELELGPGLDVLTGETGAGKTIILNALGLILGGRVSTTIIREGAEEATVEALFENIPQALKDKLREGGYTDEGALIIRRIVSRSGKNRIYLNGSLYPLNLLAELGTHLIHIYGQHEHHSLLRSETHLTLLDAHGNLEDQAVVMQQRYETFRRAWEKFKQAKQRLEKRAEEESSLRAQADEIALASLRAGEEKELEAKRNVLVNAEKLFNGCKEGEELLYESEDALVSRLGRYLLRFQQLATIDDSLKETVELLNSSLIQLEETASALRAYAGRIEFDPQGLERLEDRLDEIRRLKRKYNGSIEDILKTKEDIDADLAALQKDEGEIAGLAREFEEACRLAWEQAEILSSGRRRVAKSFKKGMEKELTGLGMPRTKFEAHFLDGNGKKDNPPFAVGGRKITEQGTDQIEFYFSPNPGEPVKPMARVASGGELSRIMLALKSLVLSQGDIPTLLFDEVDAGIGGRVAEMVGTKLKKVAATHQVICVTHLPQIAALANSHYVVEKEVSRGRTFTRVRKLSDKDKIGEVARMLGGIKVTEQARRHAAEMLNPQGENIKD